MRYLTGPSTIISAVSKAYGIPTEVLLSPNMRTPAISRARHIATYLACKLTWMSKDEIAKQFNQKDHSSVFYAFNKISVAMTTDPELNQEVEALSKKLAPK